MPNENKPLVIKPNYDLRQILAQAIKLSPDPIIRKKGRAWLPRLFMAALTVYVAGLTPSATPPPMKES